MIDILIPTLGRPDKLAAVAQNIDENTEAEHRVVFIVEAHDTDSIAAIKALGLEPVVNFRSENYAGAINSAYDETDGDLLFAAADDLNFHAGWDSECLALRDGWFGVIGTNDWLNPYVQAGSHATHYLVERAYLDEIGGVVDVGPGSFLPECYDHNFTDTEFIGTAKMRARFRPCLTSIVEHMHALAGKAEVDETYQRSVREFEADSALYDERRDLWFGITR